MKSVYLKYPYITFQLLQGRIHSGSTHFHEEPSYIHLSTSRIPPGFLYMSLKVHNPSPPPVSLTQPIDDTRTALSHHRWPLRSPSSRAPITISWTSPYHSLMAPSSLSALSSGPQSFHCPSTSLTLLPLEDPSLCCLISSYVITGDLNSLGSESLGVHKQMSRSTERDRERERIVKKKNVFSSLRYLNKHGQYTTIHYDYY